MVAKKKIIAMIPARMGSTRLKRKNLALLNGKPLIYYAIEAAKQSGVFNRIVVNSEDGVFEEIAKRNEVEFYKRAYELGGSSIRSDEVVYDFMLHNEGEITVWVNPTSPLQTSEEIKNVITYFCEGNFDSLITVREEQVHCLYNDQPLNFKEIETFAKTQDLLPVQRFVYSVMMWRNKVFQETYEKQGYAFFCGKTGYFPVSKLSSLIVKTEEDLRTIDYILTGREMKETMPIQYDSIADKIEGK
jgi:CMP-N-acetylneuraminic acid synthetase